jgi:hypothetical protein
MVSMSDPECNTRYGAIATLSYTRAATNWYWKEKVTNATGPQCSGEQISQTDTPEPMPDGTVKDEIFNLNGPPSTVAPCTHTTFQTAFIGPTKDNVEHCQYENKQEIKVVVTNYPYTPRLGKVITSSKGKEISCDWKEELSKSPAEAPGG